MRRWLPYVVAAVLGAGTAVLAACGDTLSGGIPAGDASDLKSQLDDVPQRVDDARCQAALTEMSQVIRRTDRLAEPVDAQLRERLREGADKLRGTAREECEENRLAKEGETTTTETPTETTETKPPPTTTQPPATTTTPTPTTPTPPPPPAPAPQPPQPPGPGGGTPPGDDG